ncbi:MULTISPECIES: hypothetical protein [unclassified Bradyrhizobium]|uniref:hypothetical protein n=1 Tax=unclassified Bradyrhizobium TaxID=2631580 RepID=UPI001FF56087|nr:MULTISPECIES: hypothetical protein [unclassified Bradyrhizobium]MCJ9702002.1 hypothetical protein [Bradyrhizobium sp. SHOUNA76]MCJ9729891.1 hypothetical protein [Bradyrhizobium sp. PRIMUS42]
MSSQIAAHIHVKLAHGPMGATGCRLQLRGGTCAFLFVQHVEPLFDTFHPKRFGTLDTSRCAALCGFAAMLSSRLGA